MKGVFICIVLLLVEFSQLFAQVEFGHYSEKELALERVSFEPEAKIVTLWEEGTSYFMVNGLHTDFLFRYKVLDDNIENFGDIKIPFFRGRSLVENIVKIKGQVSYLENGQRVIEVLTKDQIMEVNLGNGDFEIRLVFPHVKKGSIIEYAYKKIDHQYGILEGWAFQYQYTALFSKYTFKAPDFFQYQMIQQGKKVSEAASISTKKNEFSWLRQDIPSLPDEPFVGNLINYQERVDGYLYSSEYVNPDKLEESEMVYANWNQLANRWLDLEDVTPYFNLAPEEIKDYPVFQIDSLTKLNQAKALYDFASQEIELLSSSWLEPIYPLDKLLIEKKGNSFDKNMLLLHLLRKQGINANLVMVNDKYIGRKRLIEVPFINQFGSSVISAEIEGKNYLLDASDSIVPFGLLPLEKLVDQGFVLERGKGRLEKLHHQFRSGSIQTVKLDKNDSLGFVLKNQIRLTDHEAIKIGKAIRSFNGEGSIFENVSRFKNLDLNEINIDNQLKEKRAVTLSFDSKIEDSNGELVFIYPFQFSEFFKNPFTQESRLLPVEFQFPFFENLNSTISIPLGYELEDYPESISITIPSKSVKFSYLVNLAENELKIATKLDVTSEYFSVSEYPDLKYIFEELANHLNTPVVLKKITKP